MRPTDSTCRLHPNLTQTKTASSTGNSILASQIPPLLHSFDDRDSQPALSGLMMINCQSILANFRRRRRSCRWFRRVLGADQLRSRSSSSSSSGVRDRPIQPIQIERPKRRAINARQKLSQVARRLQDSLRERENSSLSSGYFGLFEPTMRRCDVISRSPRNNDAKLGRRRARRGPN